MHVDAGWSIERCCCVSNTLLDLAQPCLALHCTTLPLNLVAFPLFLFLFHFPPLTGHGVDVDLAKAARYLRAAGDNNVWPGAADAWFHLGVMHQAGMGMQRNPKAAASYFRMGAKVRGVVKAQLL